MSSDDLFYAPRNFGGLPPEYTSFERARVVILPVPYESTTTYMAGTRFGPLAILNASENVELYDTELQRDIFEVGIHTLPEIKPQLSRPEDMVRSLYEAAAKLISPERLLVMLGGEHTLTTGMVMAHKERWPDLSVLHLDAHADMRDEYLGAKHNHASAMRRTSEMCPVVQVGIRSMSREEADYLAERGWTPFYATEEGLTPQVIDAVIERLSPNVYVSIDIDALDPSIMSAVGTPEPGGLRWYETLRLLRTVGQRRKIVGFDVVELCPGAGPVACQFLAAKLVYKLIGYATEPHKAP